MSNTTGEVPLSDVHNTLDGLGEAGVGTAPKTPAASRATPSTRTRANGASTTCS